MTRKLIFLVSLFVAALSTSSSSLGQGAGADDGKQPVKKNPGVKVVTEPLAVEVKRRDERTDEQLRKELVTVREIGFMQVETTAIYEKWKAGGAKVKVLSSSLGPEFFKEYRGEQFFALPWIMEPDCTVGDESAKLMHDLSTRLRVHLRASVPANNTRPDPEKLKDLLAKDPQSKEWKTPQAIPTLTQMLQAENTPIRLVLVEMLGEIKGKEASVALAMRALFDLSPEVREKAIEALSFRPVEEYRQTLLDGLRYPYWTAAADHAAEAIAALRLTSAVPDLVTMLKQPAPELPVKMPVKPPKKSGPGQPVKEENKYVRYELVRINHLNNCLLCHPPSLAKDDLIRGRIPMPFEDPPPQYYGGNAASDLFVRANTTYLKQNFSVVQPVANNGKWAANQRYDYLLLTKTLTPREATLYQMLDGKEYVAVPLGGAGIEGVKQLKLLEKMGDLPITYPQRESVLFALRQLTKKDSGSSASAWEKELSGSIDALKPDKP